MKKALVLLLFVSTHLPAQKLDLDKLQAMKPRSIGPAGMAGRITAIDVIADRPEVMYVGSASGGLWKSESGGVKWEPIFDDQTTASIGSIAIQQSNPSVIWVGTGEGNPRNSLNGGDGIYKSLDGGKTWKKMGLDRTRNIHRIIVNPANPDMVYAAAIGSPWGAHPERGVYRTKDGGKTWDRILFTNEKSGCAELVIDPSNPNKLVAAMWEHYRQPWFFTSGGPGSGLYVSFDGGDTWVKKTKEDGLPEGDLGRIGLTISPANPKFIYALIESKKNALYRSTDGGFKWEQINDKTHIGDRPFYYSDIFADPVNEYRIYSIFTYVNVSNDGGESFTQLMPAYNTSRGVHPDHHAFWVHPKNPNFLIEGNDGGLNISHDRGLTWRFVQNLPIAQFYHINYDLETPYNVYGGMQDNGSWAGPAYVWRDQSIRNTYWQELSFGDGFDVVPDPDDSRYGYSMYQEGWAGRYDRITGYFEFIKPQHPDRDEKLRWNWNSAIAIDPHNSSTVYMGSQFIHMSTDKGKSWTIISPDLTTNDKQKQKQSESGGLTMDATGAENHCTILAISPSPIEKGTIWVGTDDGNIQLTRDGGKTWTNVARNIKGMPASAWIPQVKASAFNAGEALVIVNNYRQFDFKPYAYRTTDFGKTWEQIVDESDVVGYTLSIIQDPKEKNLLFLGTDDGLYVSIDNATTWTKWAKNFPTVNVMDLAIHPVESDLIIGTFGRAAWILDDITPLREIAKAGLSELSFPLKLYQPPVAHQATLQQPTGFRFGADAEFAGENRTTSARFTYMWNKPTLSEDEKKKAGTKYDSLTLEIYNSEKLLIRTIRSAVPKENGISKLEWSLDEKGVFSLTRDEINPKNEPSGVAVIPGLYTAKLKFGESSSEAALEVKGDPRIDFSAEARYAIYDSLKILEGIQQLAFERVEKLKKGLITLDDLTARMKSKGEASFKDQLEASSRQKDTLNSLLNLYVGKKDDRQGITDDPILAVDDHIENAQFYLSNSLHIPASMEAELMKKARESVLSANELVDIYFVDKWPPFRQSMEALDLSPFKD